MAKDHLDDTLAYCKRLGITYAEYQKQKTLRILKKREKENERLLRTVGQLMLERDFLQDCFRLAGKPIPSLDQQRK